MGKLRMIQVMMELLVKKKEISFSILVRYIKDPEDVKIDEVINSMNTLFHMYHNDANSDKELKQQLDSILKYLHNFYLAEVVSGRLYETKLPYMAGILKRCYREFMEEVEE